MGEVFPCNEQTETLVGAVSAQVPLPFTKAPLPKQPAPSTAIPAPIPLPSQQVAAVAAEATQSPAFSLEDLTKVVQKIMQEEGRNRGGAPRRGGRQGASRRDPPHYFRCNSLEHFIRDCPFKEHQGGEGNGTLQ